MSTHTFSRQYVTQLQKFVKLNHDLAQLQIVKYKILVYVWFSILV